MNKILLSVATLAIITTSAIAENTAEDSVATTPENNVATTSANRFFIGIDLAHHDVSITGSAAGNSASDSDTDVSPSIKAGVIADNYRAYVRYDKAYDDYDIAYDSLDVSFEGLSKVAPSTSLYYGAHLGQGWFELYGEEESGLQYGIQGGLIQDINENFSLEVGARYTMATAEFSATYNGDTYKVEADDIVTLSVGATYKF